MKICPALSPIVPYVRPLPPPMLWNMSNVEAAALAEFPELRRLIDLREAGWMFLPGFSGGELTEVRGVHTWPGGWAEAIRIRYTTDAAALRIDDDGGVVWQREGTLCEVVDGLLMLPPPSAPGAPRLVKATGPLMWTP